MIINSPILTVNEASDYLKLKSGTLYQYAFHNKIPYCKIGSRLMFKIVDLNEIIEKGYVPVGSSSLEKIS